jgi:hypothetical protein
MGSSNFVHLECAPGLFFRHIGEIKNPEKKKFHEICNKILSYVNTPMYILSNKLATRWNILRKIYVMVNSLIYPPNPGIS